MNKVMTRSQRRPAGRPPARRDPTRPTGAPPRTPGGTTARTAPDDGRPPGLPGLPSRTHPTDNRPRITPATPSLTPRPRTTPGTPPQPAVPTPNPRGPLPHPTTTDRFADLLLAVLSGQRPVHCMLRHTLGRAYDDLAHLAEHGPLRTTRGTRPVVRDIGYYEPRPGAIEAFARIGAGNRLRAMAFRLELGRDHRWRCTAVELGGPRTRPTKAD